MDLLSRLMDDEGFSPWAYRCTGGKTTIGYGRNIDRDGGTGITKTEGLYLLKNDIVDREQAAREIFGSAFWDTIDPVRKNAILNMIYQLGAGGFGEFENTIAAIKRRAWIEAGWAALDSRWAVQTPNRARRVAEEIKSGVDLG